MKTVNLELSKALKEAGYPQLKSSFHWIATMTQPYHLSYTLSDPRLLPDHNDYIASPTADEILDQLPARITNPETRNMDRLTFFIRGHAGDDSKQDVRDGFTLEYWTNFHQSLARIKGDTLADAAAKMWLYLKKEGLI